MPIEHATTFPVKGQAFRVPVAFRNNVGQLVTGWTDPSCTVSVDGGAPAAGPTPVETGSSGLGFIVLDASTMNATHVEIVAQIANVSANKAVVVVRPLAISETGRWDADEVKRFERLLVNVFARLVNRNEIDQTSGATRVYDSTDAAVALSGLTGYDGETQRRGRLA